MRKYCSECGGALTRDDNLCGYFCEYCDQDQSDVVEEALTKIVASLHLNGFPQAVLEVRHDLFK